MTAARSFLSVLMLVAYVIVAVHSFQLNSRISTKRRVGRGFKLLSNEPSRERRRKPEKTVSRGIPDGSGEVGSLPPVLEGIKKERHEYNMKVGIVMDTLSRDYSTIIFSKPDFSVYNEKLRVVDPSGVRLYGLKNYKAAFTFFQALTKFLYCKMRSTIQHRATFDVYRNAIRIRWTIRLVPKFVGSPVFIDGISYYDLDYATAEVLQHRFDDLIINEIPLKPPYGILDLLMQEEMLGPELIPAGARGFQSTNG